MEAANWQKPDTDGPRVHTQTATMWNNVNETDKEEFEDYVTKPAELGKQAKTTGEEERSMHMLTATLWTTVIYETVEEEILSKTEVSEVVKPVKKVHRKRKAKTRQG